jgi:hypothetical protein
MTDRRTTVAALLFLVLGCSRPGPARPARPAADARPPIPSVAVVPAPPPPLRGKGVTLLYSGNLLGEYEAHPLGGLARRKTLVQAVRAEAPGLVQLDAGDSLLPALAGLDRDPGEIDRRATLMARGLGQVGLDAMVPGETDLALGALKLRELARKAGVPLLAGNLVWKGKPWVPADRLVEAGEVSVGIFGVLMAPATELPAPLQVTDAVAAARASVESLRKRGARVIVGLVHATGGIEEARGLARAVPGIDVLVVGHDGATTEAPLAEGPTRLVEAHRRGTYLGRLDLGVTAGEIDARNRIVRVEPTVVPDPTLKADIKTYVDATKARLEKNLPAALSPAPRKPPDETWTYASNGACAMCHQKASDQWSTTAHAAALATLQSKGRGRDPYCFGCHVTAFQKPGGTQSLETGITYFGGVGCESCHGPSVLHVRANKAKLTRREVPEAVCRECHRDDQQPDRFDYPAALKLVLGPGHGDGGKGLR